MLLSIGLMVKNESKHLEKCLQSLVPILTELKAELIIVDTGSTDNTVDIAKRYTDKVFHHEWFDDFAVWLIVLSYCSGRFFMWTGRDCGGCLWYCPVFQIRSAQEVQCRFHRHEESLFQQGNRWLRFIPGVTVF